MPLPFLPFQRGGSSKRLKGSPSPAILLICMRKEIPTMRNLAVACLAATLTSSPVAQGQNVVKGDRLTVDLTSGTSRVECGKSQGQCRVQALIQPGSMRDKPAADESNDQ